MLDYAALAAVAAVIREGSFERAAEALGVTPSAVSQRVRVLEERLGTVLVVRGQPCTGTEAGRELCAHLDKVQLLEADLAPAGRAAVPLSIKIAVNSDSLATWFLPAAAEFAKVTGMTVDLLLEHETQAAERLRSGEVLPAVTADPEPVQGCKTTPLGRLRYLACASPSFIKRHFPKGVTKDTLALAPYLRFDRRDTLQGLWAQKAHRAELNAPTHWVPSTQSFLDAAIAGLGWGLQPISLAGAALASGSLRELPPALPMDVKLYWTATRLHSRSLTQLTEAVRGAAAVSLLNN